MMLTIYLSGCTVEADYRKQFHERFDDSSVIKLIDPIKESEELLLRHNIIRGDVTKTTLIVSDQIKKEIVEKDKLGIRKCDILVAYIKKFSAGTLMEIMYAHQYYRAILIINPGLTFKDDIWLSYHSNKMFNSIDDCSKYLLNDIKTSSPAPNNIEIVNNVSKGISVV